MSILADTVLTKTDIGLKVLTNRETVLPQADNMRWRGYFEEKRNRIIQSKDCNYYVYTDNRGGSGGVGNQVQGHIQTTLFVNCQNSQPTGNTFYPKI